MKKSKKTTTTFNTMLAHPAGKKEFDRDSFIQPKLDGIRCYITKDGAFSRNHKEFKTIDHIKKEFEPLFKTYPEIVVDGELYNHQLKDNFNKIISLVKKQKPSKNQLLDAEKYIQFHWYDYYDKKGNKLERTLEDKPKQVARKNLDTGKWEKETHRLNKDGDRVRIWESQKAN